MDAYRRISLLCMLCIVAAVCPAVAQDIARPASQPESVIAALLARSRFLNDVHFQVPVEFYRLYLTERNRPSVPAAFIAQSAECRVTVGADRTAAVEFELHLMVFDPAEAANIGVLDSRGGTASLDWAAQDITVNDKPVRLAARDGMLRLTVSEPGVVVLKAKAKLPAIPPAGGVVELATCRAVRTFISFDSPGAWSVKVQTPRDGEQAQREAESDQPWLVGSAGPPSNGTHGRLAVSPRETLRIELAPASARVVHPTRYELRGATAWNFDEGVCQVTAALRVTIAGGPADRFELLLPDGAERVHIAGPEVREAQVAPGKATVFLRGQVLGPTEVKLTFEQSRQGRDRQAEHSFGRLGIVDGHWVDGTLVVTNTAGGSEILPATATGLERIELARIPPAAAAILRGAPALAYRITGRSFDAKVEVLQLGEFALRQSIADLAHYEFFLDRDGAMAGRVKYEIRNRNQQFLRIDLPADARVLLARVNEKSCPLTPVGNVAGSGSGGGRSGPQRYLLQLERSQASVMGLVSFPVELLYVCRAQPALPEHLIRLEEKAAEIPLPQIDLPIAYAWCEGFLPDGVEVKEWSGPLRRVSDFSSQTAKASLDYGSGELAAGYLARNRPTAPTERTNAGTAGRGDAGTKAGRSKGGLALLFGAADAPQRDSAKFVAPRSVASPLAPPAGSAQPLPPSSASPVASPVAPTVTLNNADPSIAKLNLTNTSGTSVIAQGTGTGVMTFNGGIGTAAVNAASGSHTISAPVSTDRMYGGVLPSGAVSPDSNALLARNYYRTGKDYYDKGDYEQAAQNFEQVGKLAPGSVEAENATRLLANRAVLAGKFDLKSAEQQAAAAEVQREVKEQQAGTIKAQSRLLQQAEKAVKEGKTTQARIALEAATSLGPAVARDDSLAGTFTVRNAFTMRQPVGRDDASTGTFTFGGGNLLSPTTRPEMANADLGMSQTRALYEAVHKSEVAKAEELRMQIAHLKAAGSLDEAFAKAKQLRDIEGNTVQIQQELQQLAVESVKSRPQAQPGQVAIRADGTDRVEIQLRSYGAAIPPETRTTVKVPDKGTLVLGGQQRQVDELTTETRVSVRGPTSVTGAGRSLGDEIELRSVTWSRPKALAQDYLDKANMQVARPAGEEVKLTDDDFATARRNLAQAENVLQNNESVADPAEMRDLRRKVSDIKLHVAKLEERVNAEKVLRDQEFASPGQRARSIQAREALTPYDDPIYYPSAEVWQELVKQRSNAYKVGRVADSFQRAPAKLPEGVIAQVFPDMNMVNLRLAHPSQAKLGSRYVIFRKDKPIPDNLEGKAVVEISGVDSGAVQAKIIKTSASDPILPGDLTLNLGGGTGGRQAPVMDTPTFLHGIGNYTNAPAPGWEKRVRPNDDYFLPEADKTLASASPPKVIVYKLKNSDAQSTAKLLKDLFAGKAQQLMATMGTSGQAPKSFSGTVSADARTNTLVVSGTSAETELIDEIVNKVDSNAQAPPELRQSGAYVKVYDVRDLMHPLSDFHVPAVSKTLSTSSNTGTIFGGTDAGGAAGEADDTESAAGRAKKTTAFLNMLKSAVAADTWGPAGGANIKETDGLLVVKQSAEGHRQLEDLLGKLQEGSGPQVEIGGRLARQQVDVGRPENSDDSVLSNLDWSGSISGSGQITKSGGGTLTLSDAERNPQLKKFIESNYDLKAGPGYIIKRHTDYVASLTPSEPTEAFSPFGGRSGGDKADWKDFIGGDDQRQHAERWKLNQASDLADKLRRNLGQKVVVNSENLAVTADQAGRLGIAFHKGAADLNAAVVDEAQFRALAELEAAVRVTRPVDVNATLQETIVGTGAKLANGGEMRVRFAGDRGNWLEFSGNYVDLPHDRYLLIDNGEFLTAVRAGPMQHWTAKPADVSFYQVPQTIELPRVGQVVRSEKTLVAPSDRLILRVTYTLKGDNP